MSHPDYELEVALRRQEEAQREVRAFNLARGRGPTAPPLSRLRSSVDRALVRLGQGATEREGARRARATAAGRRC